MENIRLGGRADQHTTLQEYRQRQAEAYFRRNAQAISRARWAEKAKWERQ